MMNRTTDGRGTETVVSMPQPFDLAPVMEASRPTLSAAAEINGRIYETLAAFNTQYVSFVNRRLKEDFGMPGKFASCRSLEDVYGVYADFFRCAAEHYQAEFEQLAKFGQSVAQDAATQVKEQAQAAKVTARDLFGGIAERQREQSKGSLQAGSGMLTGH